MQRTSRSFSSTGVILRGRSAPCHLKDAVGTLLINSDDQVWPWVRDRLYLVLAAESAAGTHAALADAVDYAKQRVAFGRPIGSFQAIKHQLAELAGQAECATASVHYAAWALSENDARAPLSAAMAQSYASEAYRAATYRNIQVFGAIGFTWEMKNHLFYKRARSNAALLGLPPSNGKRSSACSRRKPPEFGQRDGIVQRADDVEGDPGRVWRAASYFGAV